MNNIILNSPFGYYQVGNQFYLNKTEATYNASKNRLPLKWNFFEEIFSKYDWSARPAGTLQDLYKERAQQIRDQYDHVIVNFSGGMDSWNVLYSFLNNGIHVDEIYTSWPRAERKVRPLSTSTDQWNMGSEYEFAVLPLLKEIRKKYPKTNIVINDFSSDIEKDLNEDAFYGQHNYQNMPGCFKFRNQTELEKQAIKQNKKVAVVVGSEKLTVCVKNGNFYAFFSDHSNNADHGERTVEFFYWSVHLPELPILQAHYIKDEIMQNYAVDKSSVPFPRQAYREIFRKSCYPEYNPDTFQAKKQLGSMVWESDLWIKEYNPRYYESWKWLTEQYFNTIDEKYTQRRANDIVGLHLVEGPHHLIQANTGLPDFKF